MRRMFKNVVIVGLIVCMSLMTVSCKMDKGKIKEEDTKKVEEIENKYIEGAVTPSTCFGKEERTIWYYIKDKTENDAIQSVDADAIIDTIYVFENGNVITYDLDYEEFALDNKLGDFEKMSDDAIIEWLDENRQSEAQRYEDFKESELAIGADIEAQGTLEKIELIERDGEVEKYAKYAMAKNPYLSYIFYLKKFDASLFNDGFYKLNVETDDSLENVISEELSFGYRNAKTIPQFVGMVFDYDKDNIVFGEYVTDNVEYIASEPAEGKNYTFIDSKPIEQVGSSYYGGFEVENSYNYGATLENGWFVTRTDKNIQFGLDAVGTEGVDTNGLSNIEEK